jgi:hypothetical protein
MRAVVLPGNLFDSIAEGMGRPQDWAGAYGHVVRPGVPGVVHLKIEGSIHGTPPDGHDHLTYWSFLESEVEHAD